NITQLRVGQKLELECLTDKPNGAFWIHRDKSGTLHFIVFINSTARATFEGNQKTSTRFKVGKEGMVYHLVVKSFTRQDEGKYYCMVIFNQKLYFSRGQPAFLSGPWAAPLAPPEVALTPAVSTWWTFLFSIPAESRMQEDLDHFCLVFLWVPFTGLCLLLLQLLANTIVLRRRT
ncbi:CD8A protein, partial [Sterrhoptilus dennistouni]|nr:CD8A protein [Sterrhoptilus dennistouni]